MHVMAGMRHSLKTIFILITFEKSTFIMGAIVFFRYLLWVFQISENDSTNGMS